MSEPVLPELPYESWRATVDTVHRFTQIVGKVRLATAPRRNHWWQVPFHLTGRGITTRPMGRSPIFTIDFDFLDHRLELTTTTGIRHGFGMPGLSVADFHQHLESGLRAVGADVQIARPYPYDLPDGDRHFAADTEHVAYDPGAMTRGWQVLSQVNLLLEEFAGQWSGKTSPVHLFWHSFDLALTRFSDRPVDQSDNPDPVGREGYCRELISSGFWFGDDSFPTPAFYSYTAPEPAGLTEQALRPATAQWRPSGSGHTAVLRYEDVRTQADPHAVVLDFFDSAYRAGADLAGWDRGLDSPGGVTDPVLRGH